MTPLYIILIILVLIFFIPTIIFNIGLWSELIRMRFANKNDTNITKEESMLIAIIGSLILFTFFFVFSKFLNYVWGLIF